MRIQESAENYLETILILQKRHGQVRSIDIASELSFSKPSVSIAMKNLRANELIELLRIRVPNCLTPVEQLSGGNQQKVIFAKWLNKDLDVLVLDEPTRGIDIGAKLEIYNLIRRLAAEGKAVLLITSEIDEMVDLADRVAVLRGGKIVAEETGGGINDHNLMHLALEGGAEYA